MIASEKTFKSNTIASNKWSHYSAISFSKCWSNMLNSFSLVLNGFRDTDVVEIKILIHFEIVILSADRTFDAKILI